MTSEVDATLAALIASGASLARLKVRARTLEDLFSSSRVGSARMSSCPALGVFVARNKEFLRTAARWPGT